MQSTPDIVRNTKIFQRIFLQTVRNTRVKNSVIINGNEIYDVVIVHNYYNSENTIKQNPGMLLKENIFQNTLKKIHIEETSKKQADFSDNYLKVKRSKLNDLLMQGTISFRNGIYIKALDFYENALKLIKDDDYPDEFNLTLHSMVSIKYSIALCNFSLNNYGSLSTSKSQLKRLINEHGLNNTFPFLYLALANIYFALKQYEKCTDILEDGLRVVEKCNFYDALYWPGTTSVIDDINLDTVKLKMETLIKECSNVGLPDGYCFYDLCLETGNSQRPIYFE